MAARAQSDILPFPMAVGAAGTFSSGQDVPVPQYEGLALAITRTAIDATTVQGRYRSGVLGNARSPPVGGTIYYPSSLYTQVKPSGAAANLEWEIVDVRTIDPLLGAFDLTKLIPGPVFDGQMFAPTTIAAATAETTEQAGATTVPQGSKIRGRLAMEGVIATVADALTYVALKGHTSGRYYAVCFAPGQLYFEFRQVNASELLDLVARNQDTVAHGLHGSWEAFTSD